MTEEQSERVVAALETIAKACQASAVMQEEQLGALGDIQRRLAEIAENLENGGAERD